MKANEAPEEIYLLPDDRNPNHLSICWYEAPYRTGAIEYTRTDTFIEKACEYLMEYEFNDSPTIADRRKRVDDLKQAIKDE